MEITLGEMLYRFRKERELDEKQICEGLCSTSAISFYELGERIPDILLFERLVERMGVSPEEFSLMVTKEEYVYYEWKEKVYKAIEDRSWKELGELLELDVSRKIYCNEKLEKQFYSYVKAIHYAMQKKYDKAVVELKIAQEQTISNIEILNNNDLLLGLEELHILMMYLYCGVKGMMLNIKEAVEIFWKLENYVSNSIIDINEKAKCYPKLICIGFHCLKEKLQDIEQLKLCEKAIFMMQENKTFHDITEILYFYIPLLEKYHKKEVSFYKKQYEVFCDILQSEEIDCRFCPEILDVSKSKIFMVHEYLLSKRKERNITQEKLSEGICEPETYSRVENGKRAPSRKNFNALVDRLDIGWCNYRGELNSCELKVYQLKRKQRAADIEGGYQDSLDILHELELLLDMNYVPNYQYIKSYECIAKSRLLLMRYDEAYRRLDELLKLSQKLDLDTSRLVYYSQTELEIIGYMAQLLQQQGKYREGIHLIESVLKQMMHSKVNIEHQWNGYCFIIGILGSLYFEIGEYETTIKIITYVKCILLKRREGANLCIMLDEIADALENIGEQYREEYKKLYRQTYYVADFFAIQKVTEFAKKYYEDNFDAGIVWYED